MTQSATLQRRCRDISLVVVHREFTEIRLEEGLPSEVEKKTERERGEEEEKEEEGGREVLIGKREREKEKKKRGNASRRYTFCSLQPGKMRLLLVWI